MNIHEGLFCQSNSPKPKRINFTTTESKEKHTNRNTHILDAVNDVKIQPLFAKSSSKNCLLYNFIIVHAHKESSPDSVASLCSTELLHF